MKKIRQDEQDEQDWRKREKEQEHAEVSENLGNRINTKRIGKDTTASQFFHDSAAHDSDISFPPLHRFSLLFLPAFSNFFHLVNSVYPVKF